MSTKPAPREVFLSYASEDESLCLELEKHLSLLKREGLITTWHKGQIGVGTDIDKEIGERLSTASIIVLLLSAGFVASDVCYSVEMGKAIERHEAGEASVIPVVLRPMDDWSNMPFGKLQSLPSDGRPVVSWPDRDDAFANVAQSIRSVVQNGTHPPVAAPASLPAIWPEKDEQDQNSTVQAVKAWLQSHQGWLLILDNADDLTTVREFVPSVFGGHLLLTTRTQATGQLARRIEVDTMPQDIGALFLLRRDVAEKTLSVHRLVQAVLRDAMDEQTRQRWTESALQVVNKGFPDFSVTTLPQCERYLPHALECAALIEQENIVTKEVPYFLCKTGSYLINRIRYAEAEPLFRRALSICEQALEVNLPGMLLSLYYLAALYCLQGEYAEAEPLFRRALSICEQTLEVDHPGMLFSFKFLADLSRSRGKYAEAEAVRSVHVKPWQHGGRMAG